MKPFATLLDPILKAFPALSAEDLSVGPPPKLAMGDLAVRLFEAARKLEMPPPQLATQIAAEVQFSDAVSGVTAAGPYVNLRLHRDAFGRAIVAEAIAQGGRYGSGESGLGRRALIEHTSINPNASPHVGRARNAMIGDSLSRLLRFEGFDTEVHYYVNDMGRQIGLLVLVCDDLSDISFDDMLRKYVEANRRAEEDPAFAEEGYAMLAKMEEGDPEVKQRFYEVTDICLKGQLAVLARLGVTYDAFDRESQFIEDPRLDAVVEALKEKGAVFVDEEGRLTVDLNVLGHGQEEGRFFALRRSNGSSMYGYRDLAYTMFKMERGADLDLIVLGEDHKLYMHQVALMLQATGKPTPEPIYYSYIILKEGKMSTRQGKVVLLSDFLDEATARAVEKVREQWPDLAPEQQTAIAEQVAVAAIRFAILRVSPQKNVVFDWDSSLSFTGDTGPYVQYSCARIASIVRKYGAVPEAVAEAFPVEKDVEWALLLKVASFGECIAQAVNQRNCVPIAQFALDTAKLFSSFYHECPVIDAPTEAQRHARVQLCVATRQVLENALHLLGIQAAERM